MAMGHKERLRGGDEHDCFSRRSRGAIKALSRPGTAKKTKARFSRRVRREAKLDALAAKHLPTDT